MCNKPSAEKSRGKVWICHTGSALRPITFKLLIGVLVNTWCWEQIFLLSFLLSSCHALVPLSQAVGGVGQGCSCRIKLILALLQRSVYIARSTRFNYPYLSSCKNERHCWSWILPVPFTISCNTELSDPPPERGGKSFRPGSFQCGLFTFLCPQLHPVVPCFDTGRYCEDQRSLFPALYLFGYFH